ncbi:MAG: PKD domain-containing protein [Chitinophagaceae bacterium]|nr:PKD domain-containing protein [Chitinophagaceae bacterium]
MRKLHIVSTLVLAALFCQSNSYGQDFSNKGKEFWVAYGYHASTTTNQMVLYFAAEQTTNVTVNIPGVGYTQNYVVPANTTIASAAIPRAGAQDVRLLAESTIPEDKGIHITSDYPIVAYAHIYNGSVSGATILFPKNTLGKEYYSVNYENISNVSGANCWVYVVAADTGKTTVEITPSAQTINHPAGVPFTVNLTQGQVFNLMGYYDDATNRGVDLSGTKIKSIASGSGACKKIAVFSGSGRISITCNGSSSSSDNYIVQAFPQTAWGKKYLTVPSVGYNVTAGNTTSLPAFNIYRICVSDPTTVVSINGSVTGLPLINNFYYEISATNLPQLIEADKPVVVAQYFPSRANCGNPNPAGDGDPEVLYLSSVEQNINKVLWNANAQAAINPLKHYINAIITNAGTAISSFRLDGISVPASSFVIHPQDPKFSYVKLNVSSTNGGVGLPHRIESDSGFNAIAYGYGAAESYGYNAGTNIKDIFQYISVQNEYGTVNFPATCKDAPFFFSMTFPYQPTQIQWIFGPLLNAMGIADVTLNSPVPTSTIVVAGKTLYVYQLPSNYNIPTVGTYPIKVVANNPTPDGCSGIQEIDFDVQVFAKPIADFNFNNVCFPDPVQFTDNSNTNGRAVNTRYWSFGDATNSTVNNPSHSYSAPGPYTVKYSLITDIGCIADTISKVVTISPLPTASIAGNIEVCLNGTSPNVTFTGAVGTAPYPFTYNINGGSNQTATTISGNSVTVVAPTNVAGTFVYNLVSVSDASLAVCTQAQSGAVTVQVNPLPTATISGTLSVCKNGTSPNITFTAAGGAVAPYTFTYNINGGLNQTVTTVIGNSVTVSVPTGTAGTFTYNLLNVSDASTTLCGQAQAGSATVTVIELPTAIIAGTTEVCLNGASPLITFTAIGSAAPYTFTYNINGGANQTITTVGGNSVTVAVPTGIDGTFIYNLVGVQDGGSTSCSQAQTGAATVIVNKLPTRNFTTNTPTCETRDIQFTDASLANAGVLNNWQWNFGDPGSGAANTSALQNPTHNYANVGTYNVSLTVTTDKGCVSIGPSIPVTIERRPLAGFSFPEVCFGDPFVPFTDTSKVVAPDNVSAWNWNFGDPPSGAANTSALQNPQHTYPAVGAYNIQLVAISNKGCTDTIVNSLFINGSNPTADFNVMSPTMLCSSDTIMISEASSVLPGTITKVEIYWDNVNQPLVFDTDDVPVTGKIYKHKYPTTPVTRTYTIRYRAYSGGICVNDKFTPITVNGTPVVQFNDIPAACYDAAPFQITQASETGGVAGTAVYSGPGVSSSGIFDPVAAGIGTFTIKYVYTATAGGCLDSMSKSITVLDTASARFSYSPTVCENAAISFNSSISTIPAASGTITGWNWNFGDPGSGAANTSTLDNPTHTFSTWGNYNVTLDVTTSNGCRSTTNTTPVFVNPLPSPDFSFPPSVCLPSANVVFANASSIADGTASTFTYLWDFGDPASGGANSSTGSGPSHIYNAVGPYNVNLQVTSGAGCVLATTKVLNTIHPQPTGSFTVDRDDICIGESFSFTDNSNPADGTTTTWEWMMSDGNTRSVPTFNYTYGSAGEFDVNLVITNSHGCRSTVSTKKVTVNAYPTVNAGPDLFILEGGSDTLNAVVTANNPTYLWTPNTYFISSNTIKNPIVKGVQDITYTLTVTGRGNCVVSDQVFIKVLKGPEIPNIFSPNGDGVHDKWVIKYLDTYPECTVDIFNRYGQSIYHSVGYGIPWDGTINGKPVPIGTYYYIVNPKNGRVIITGYVDVIR